MCEKEDKELYKKQGKCKNQLRFCTESKRIFKENLEEARMLKDVCEELRRELDITERENEGDQV